MSYKSVAIFDIMKLQWINGKYLNTFPTDKLINIIEKHQKNYGILSHSEGPFVAITPISVVQLIYNLGDVKCPQTFLFNFPNAEKIVKEWRTTMVMLKKWL